MLTPAPLPALQSDCARWCIVWQFAVLQNSTGAKQLHASAQMELSEAEAAVMAASTKTRVTAANKVRRIIVAGGLTEGEASGGGGEQRSSQQRCCGGRALLPECSPFVSIKVRLRPPAHCRGVAAEGVD